MNRHPLSPGGNTLVVLDTCVLLPSRLSDVLFDLMLAGLRFNNARLIEGYGGATAKREISFALVYSAILFPGHRLKRAVYHVGSEPS